MQGLCVNNGASIANLVDLLEGYKGIFAFGGPRASAFPTTVSLRVDCAVPSKSLLKGQRDGKSAASSA